VLLPFAKRQGKKMGFYNVTAGPVTTPKGREMLLRLSEQMDFITVRDQTSYTILQELGVQNPNILVTADAALNTRPASSERIDQILTSLGLRDEGEVLAVNVNPYLDSWAGLSRAPMTREHFVATYSRALNRVAREIKVPLLFLSTQHLDVSLTKELMARVHEAPKKVLFSNTEYNHHEIKGVMGRMSLLSGMRLHAIILTSSAQTPVIGLNYLPKVDHYFRELGQQEFNMSFEHFNEENLVHHILTATRFVPPCNGAYQSCSKRRIKELSSFVLSGREKQSHPPSPV
jgi:polysaccharide pyruvyl transferase WcaK-like protein